MDIIGTGRRVTKSDAVDNHLCRASVAALGLSVGVDNLNVETLASSPFLPADRKWAIRFNAGGTTTIVLGMKDYGRGWFSAYFADQAAVRLGIPFSRIRVYYSGTLPAVLQAPIPSPFVPRRSHIGPIASAAADIIEGLCDQVIRRGRMAVAAIAGVDAVDVGFEPPSGRFLILGKDWSRDILELAETVRGGTAGALARYSIPKKDQMSSAA